MTEAEAIAAQKSALPKVKQGSLRFWGKWFGRPYDNIHVLVRCEASENVLRLDFELGEHLSLWSPRDLSLDSSTFQIADAERVLLEWYSYGSRKIPENLLFKDYAKKGETIVERSNSNRHSPDVSTNPSMPAVEILGFYDMPR